MNIRTKACKQLIVNYLLNNKFVLHSSTSIYCLTKDLGKGNIMLVLLTIANSDPVINLSVCYSFGNYGLSSKKKILSWYADDLIIPCDIKYKIKKNIQKIEYMAKRWNETHS